MSAGRHDGGRLATVSGAVLTGGASSRMGSDKSRVLLAGVPLATRVAATLAALFDEVLLVGGSPPDEAEGRRVPDVDGPRCALRGLAAALEAASAPRVLVVATDLALVTPELLLALVAWPEADAVVPRTGDGAHPLCAIYRRAAVLDAARERLAGGALKLQGLLGAVETRWLDPEDVARVDPDGHALANLNTAEELERAESLLRALGA